MDYSQSLAFRLSQIGARTARLFADRLAPLGVSPRAFGVLSNLAKGEGQNQQQLADALGIHRNNMVGLVDEMELAGWVRRERSNADRRAFGLHLTTKGRSVVRQVNDLIPPLEDQVAGSLTAADQATLAGILERIAADLGLDDGVHPHLSARSRSARQRRGGALAEPGSDS